MKPEDLKNQQKKDVLTPQGKLFVIVLMLALLVTCLVMSQFTFLGG